LLRIVEQLARNAHPFTQAIATGIVEWHASIMRSPSRRLPSNQNARIGMQLEDGTRSVWQVRGANGAASNLGEQRLRGCHIAA
jgi:hypothetical protein